MTKVPHILTAFAWASLSTSIVHANNQEIFTQNLPGDSLTVPESADSLLSMKKICVCRLVEVRSDSYETHLAGFFAEKTSQGKPARDYKILNEYIRREKEYFRFAFLQSLKQKTYVKTKRDCRSLYQELKKKNRKLNLYNIIDVDALMALAKRP